MGPRGGATGDGGCAGSDRAAGRPTTGGRDSVPAVLAHEFPGRQFMVPAVVPEGLADGFMLGNGSQHGERSQWEMGCSLA